MKKISSIVLILAVVLLYGGCASTASRGDKTVTSATAAQDEKEDMAAAAAAEDETAADSNSGEAGKVLKKAVDETADAVKDSAKVFDKTAKKLGHNVQAAADVVAEDFNSVKNAAANAVKDAKGKGEFPWWIIILIIILLILIIIFATRKKENKPK